MKILPGKLQGAIRHPLRTLALSYRLFRPKDPEQRRRAHWIWGKLPRVTIDKIFPEARQIDLAILKPYRRLADTSIELQELVAIVTVARCLQAEKILEIGTYDGNTTLNLAANTGDNAVITTVDLPVDWNRQPALAIPREYVNDLDMEHHRVEPGRQFKGTPQAGKIRQILRDSATLDWDALPHPFDLVFVDGCHHYRYVRHDTEKALRYTRSGGAIIWHDYPNMTDVSRAVDEFAGRIDMAAISGTRLVVGVKP